MVCLKEKGVLIIILYLIFIYVMSVGYYEVYRIVLVREIDVMYDEGFWDNNELV